MGRLNSTLCYQITIDYRNKKERSEAETPYLPSFAGVLAI